MKTKEYSDTLYDYQTWNQDLYTVLKFYDNLMDGKLELTVISGKIRTRKLTGDLRYEVIYNTIENIILRDKLIITGISDLARMINKYKEEIIKRLKTGQSLIIE